MGVSGCLCGLLREISQVHLQDCDLSMSERAMLLAPRPPRGCPARLLSVPEATRASAGVRVTCPCSVVSSHVLCCPCGRPVAEYGTGAAAFAALCGDLRSPFQLPGGGPATAIVAWAPQEGAAGVRAAGGRGPCGLKPVAPRPNLTAVTTPKIAAAPKRPFASLPRYCMYELGAPGHCCCGSQSD